LVPTSYGSPKSVEKFDFSETQSDPSPTVTPKSPTEPFEIELSYKVEPFPPSPSASESMLTKSVLTRKDSMKIEEELPNLETAPVVTDVTTVTSETNEPCIVEAKLVGGPFHTSVLTVTYTYRGGKEGPTMFEWQASKFSNGPEDSFQVIHGIKCIWSTFNLFRCFQK
jgi:hypothetical protein